MVAIAQQLAVDSLFIFTGQTKADTCGLIHLLEAASECEGTRFANIQTRQIKTKQTNLLNRATLESVCLKFTQLSSDWKFLWSFDKRPVDRQDRVFSRLEFAIRRSAEPKAQNRRADSTIAIVETINSSSFTESVSKRTIPQRSRGRIFCMLLFLLDAKGLCLHTRRRSFLAHSIRAGRSHNSTPHGHPPSKCWPFRF